MEELKNSGKVRLPPGRPTEEPRPQKETWQEFKEVIRIYREKVNPNHFTAHV